MSMKTCLSSVIGNSVVKLTGKTGDWTVDQKTAVDPLHKERQPQKVIAPEAGCSEGCVQAYEWKLSGRKQWGRKRC